MKYFEQILKGDIPLSIDAKQVKLKSIFIRYECSRTQNLYKAYFVSFLGDIENFVFIFLCRPVPAYDIHGVCIPSVQILRMAQMPQLLFSNQSTQLR